MRQVRWLIVFMLAMTLTAWGQEGSSGPDGSVSSYTASEGTMRGAFAPDAAIESRDIFTIVQKGQPIGEAMVIKVGSKGDCTLLPKGNLKGTPRTGDILRFARHAEKPVDGTESWSTFTAPEFSVSVPTPMVGPTVKTGSGNQGSYTAQVWMSVDASDDTAYIVGISRYRLNPLGNDQRWVQRSLETYMQEYAQQQGGTLRWTRPVRGEQNPACDFEMLLKDGATMRGRQILFHTNLYMAIASSKSKSISSRSWRFVNSFKITPKD